MSDADGFQNHSFGSFVGFGLDHNHLLEGGSDAHEAVASLTLISRGVYDILVAYVGNIGGGNRSVPGHVGRSNGDGSAQGSHATERPNNNKVI